MGRYGDNPVKFLEDCIKYFRYAEKNIRPDIEAKSETKDDDKSRVSDSVPEKNVYETMKNTEKNEDGQMTVIRDALSYNLIQEDWMNSASLEELDSKINKCTKCHLSDLRKNFVFGTGNPDADVAVVGEAPGADEDLQGKPFVGRAGQLLTDILKAIQFSRDDVFICNILKCRPPGNRSPLPDEVTKCEPYLFKQLDLINPKLILALGASAAQTLLKTKEPLGKLRGRFFDFRFGDKKALLFVTFHPAALLRNPNWKRPTWEDVQLFRKKYDEIKKV